MDHTGDGENWSQPHVCVLCGARWDCRYTLCLEPYRTECRKCKCGLPLCGLMSSSSSGSLFPAAPEPSTR